MGYDRIAPRRKVELELNGDLLRQVSAVTPDLGATVERLLAEHLEREARRASDASAYLAQSNPFCERFGDWADAFSVL